MRNKKVLPFILMLTLSLFPESLAADIDMVILVSDNEADSTLAESVANIIGAKGIVKVPWGIYNPNYSAEVLKYVPDRVIIIGGPTAVPIDYEKDFEEMGIPYERLWGKNRYETNLAVIQKLKNEFPEEFSQIETVYITHGRDVLSMLMQKELKQMPSKSIWIFTDKSYEELTLQALDEVIKTARNRPWVEIVITSRFVQLAPIDTITNFLKQRGYTEGAHFTISNVRPAKRFILEALKLVDNKTQMAAKFLDGLDIPRAKRRLSIAKEQIARAWKLYSLGDYQEAYILAVAASRNADFVISISAREWNGIIQGRPEIRLKREVLRLEAKVKVLKELGMDVSTIEAEINELKAILNKPVISPDEYRDILLNKIPQIKKELREAFIEEKRSRRRIPVEHVPGRGEKDRAPRKSGR